MDKNARILIVGGGIGGLTLAYWLHHNGFKPTVIEKASGFGNVGYALSATGHSIDIMRQMGLTDKLVSKSYKVPRGVMMTDKGRVLKRFSMERFTDIEYGNIGINRADLHLILYDAVKDKVDVRFKQTITSITNTADKVEVVLDNGSTETYDVLIGADGIHSTVRHMVFGDGFERYFNIAYMSFLTPNIFGIEAANHDMFGDGRMVSIGGYSKDDVGAFFLYKAAPGEQLTPEQRKARLLELFGGFKWKVVDVIKAVKPETIFHDDLVQIQMPAWSKDRVVLIGDAAYCLSPLSGKGTSMAIFAAHYLAAQLAQYDYAEAFMNYDIRMRDGIARFQKQTADFGKTVLPEGALFSGLRNVLTQLTPNWYIYRIFTKEATERIY
jgi:2-polyprenyl-6-methoxyphenol hydroxylase-like FAD-dependent oxidoreductase